MIGYEAQCSVCGKYFILGRIPTLQNNSENAPIQVSRPKRFCTKCGSEIDPLVGLCPNCDRTTSTQAINQKANTQTSDVTDGVKPPRVQTAKFEFNCSHCGRTIVAEEGDRGKYSECPHCGARVSAGPASPMVQSILCTVCCCMPLGIAAIVFSTMANAKLAAGDVKGAQAMIDTAKIFITLSIVFGVIGGIIVFITIAASH